MTARYLLRQLSSVWNGELFEIGSSSEPTSPRRQRTETSESPPSPTAYIERAKHLFAFWKQKEKDESVKHEKEKHEHSNHTPIRNRTVPVTVQSTNRNSVTLRPARNWKNDTRLIWMKPLSQLPVASDLPRLVNAITLYDETEEELFRGSSESVSVLTVREKMLTFLIALAKLVETQENNEKLETMYRKFVIGTKSSTSSDGLGESNETGLLSSQFGRFLSDGIKEETTLVRVLKTIHQSIIAPAIIELRLGIMTTIPFKDAGGWKIAVRVFADKITVSHKKLQQPTSNKPEDQFSFEWHLNMELNSQATSLTDAHLTISQLDFPESASAAKQEEIKKLFGELIETKPV